ncbi:MAG: flagellar basal body rod protein FlgC, partial [Ignavibacteriaceae bacterium]|nr:flagellar basal body rod protein FlgC [Ignavibacteriaceae bacterium]
MKIGGEYSGFNISAKGMSVQRRKMNLIAENIANADNIRTEEGKPYQRKYMVISQKNNLFTQNLDIQKSIIPLAVTNANHIALPGAAPMAAGTADTDLNFEEKLDNKVGDVIYMPDNPDADEDG